MAALRQLTVEQSRVSYQARLDTSLILHQFVNTTIHTTFHIICLLLWQGSWPLEHHHY